MAPVKQILVAGEGTRVVNVSSDATAVSCVQLYALAEEWGDGSTGRTSSSVTLLKDGRTVSEDGILPLDGSMTIVRAVTGSLPGGKGGFGAQLRAAGRGSKGSASQDECRDLQGRRIKYQNRENMLKEWEEDAPNRELEQLAERHIKEREKQKKRDAIELEAAKAKEDVEEAYETNARAMQSAVHAGLKRKRTGPAAQASNKAKKPIGVPGFDDDAESDSEGSGDAEGTSAAVRKAPLDQQGRVQWDEVEDASDLEPLGMERLETELKRHGARCGGTIKECAGRLFQLRSCAFAQSA